MPLGIAHGFEPSDGSCDQPNNTWPEHRAGFRPSKNATRPGLEPGTREPKSWHCRGSPSRNLLNTRGFASRPSVVSCYSQGQVRAMGNSCGNTDSFRCGNGRVPAVEPVLLWPEQVV